MRATARPVEGVTEQLRSEKLSHTRARCASATRSGAAIGLAAIGLAEIGLAPRSSKNRSAVCRTPLASSALRAGQGAVCRSTSTRQARGNTVGSLDKTPFTSRWARLARQPTQLANAHSQPHGSQTNRRSPQADHTARLKMPSSTTVDDKRMAFKVTFNNDLQHSNNITL